MNLLLVKMSEKSLMKAFFGAITKKICLMTVLQLLIGILGILFHIPTLLKHFFGIFLYNPQDQLQSQEGVVMKPQDGFVTSHPETQHQQFISFN